jgi:outer membrane protein assembly factor BamA
VLDRFAKAVAEFLKEPQVTAKVLSNRNGELAVVFQPNSLPSVAEVMFKGNDLFATRELQEIVAGAAIGAIYTEERFREIIDTSLRPLYESKGRIRVAFPKFETRPAEKVNGLVVTVHINEGPVYELRNVSLAGGPESLLKEGAFRLGETVRFDQVQEGVKRIEAAMKRAGYIDAKTAVDRNIDDKAKKLDLVIRATPGQQYKFGKLDIDGLDIQTEPHIRKLWNMKTNQPFNAEYPDYFLSRLQSDGVFENLGKTASTLKRDDQNRLVDVTLHFKASGKALPRIGPMSDKEAAREREEQRKRREQNPNDPFPR